MRDDLTSHAARIEAQREDVRFRILRALEDDPSHSQRSLSRDLGVSLGAVNFLLNALIEKGHVKARNFREAPNKVRYIYVLTPQGIAAKARLARGFLQRKQAEYEALKQEIAALKEELGGDEEWTS